LKRKFKLEKRDAAVAKRIARWKKKFIAALAKAPSVKHACLAAGISRDCAYDNRSRDPEFAAAWQAALDSSIDEVEAKAIRFVLEGPADNSSASAWANLAIFLLKSHKRSVYGDKIEAAFAGGIIMLPAKTEGPE
jgi:hypothetical protein